MTFSILAFDEKTGSYGGAAATGSLCVGGWVLRGTVESGMSASQGTAPSTLWGDEVLTRMRSGTPAPRAVAEVTAGDPGAAYRQLSALSPDGQTGDFTGAASVAWCGARSAPHVVVAGNMLHGADVLDAVLARFLSPKDSTAPFAQRLLGAIRAGHDIGGGDSRGLLSSALLVVSRSAPPLSLRIDYSEDPLDALDALYARSQAQPYKGWTDLVPTLDAPGRSPEPGDTAVSAAGVIRR